jgi:hypothetical protein
MKILCFLFVCAVVCPVRLWASDERLFYIAPTQLVNTNRQMDTAGFWISRHSSPNEVVMSPQEIDAFNAHIQKDLNLTKDIFAITANFKTESLMASFNKTIADFNEKGFYTASGVRNDLAFMDKARRNMNLSGVVLGIVPRYGLVTHYADVRFFPLDEGLYESSGDFDFDEVQNSTLDVGTPVAVVHQSADKKWYYVFSALSDGWIQADRVALGETKTVEEFVQSKRFAMVIKPKADIFLNEGLTDYYDHMRMGTRVALVDISGNKAHILVPVADKDNKLQILQGYMEKDDIHEGYLPYTPRSILRQAFAMLNQGYGWGGMYGKQDCSAFLDEVFATVGIVLPRDSKNQALAGKVLANFDNKISNEHKIQALKDVPGGTAILPMRGHIMLYLGMFEGRPYGIHAIWAYREHKGGKDIPRVINHVTVSDLSLGEGSQKGSLLKRLSRIVHIQ